MKKLVLRMSLTALCLTIGSFLAFARQQPCSLSAGGDGSYTVISWTVSGSNCCSPQRGISFGYGSVSYVSHGSYSSYNISVADAQYMAGCPMVYNPQ